MRKPLHTLGFLIAVIIILGIISLIIPESGWKINDKISINFPTFENILNPEDVEYADISKIIEKHSDTASMIKPDTSSGKRDTVRANADSLRKHIHKIEMTSEGRDKLASLFEKLKTVSSGNPVRIWHYGDSQIESDRISGFIRENLQRSFGGYGTGLLSLTPVTQKLSWRVQPQGNWERYTLFGKVDSTIPHKQFGPMLCISRFSPFWNDSLPNDSVIYKASVSLKNSFMGYKHTHSFSHAKLFYGNIHKPVKITIKNEDGKILHVDSLMISDKKINTYKLPVKSGISEFSMHFEGYDSPDFYGISLESSKGVLVDNIPLRGSSGLIFSRIDYGFYLNLLTHFDVDMIIMQFGINVVSEEKENFKYYERWIYRQLQTIKKMRPDIPVLVIGPSDMATKKGTKYVTYESVPKIRSALKNATLRSGYCFWDLYEAMGGKNSMPSWVFAKPPLAGKDFTHFNQMGAQIISNMIYNALMFEYQNYLNKIAANSEEE
ncbi:MAG: hypothetical protein K9H84_01300 [Bacteroidales bacterium]|nr:hypothetical protein [Bacteroidales bacterium]